MTDSVWLLAGGGIALAGFGMLAAWHAIRHWYVTVNPDEYVVHYRNGEVMHMGRGLSFLCLPYDTFLKVPSTIRDINFVADQITQERQGVRVQGFLAYKIADFEQAYRSLDLRSKTMKVLRQCEENVQNNEYDAKNQESVVTLDPHDPLAKTDLVMRRLAESVVRHEVSNKTVDQMITERESVIRSMKEQMQETVRSWGIEIDTIEFTEVWIRSKELFENLQAEYRNRTRLEAARSTADTDRSIAEKTLETDREIATLRAQSERVQRVTRSEQQREARQTEIADTATVSELELQEQLRRQRQELENQREIDRVNKEREYALRQKQLELEQREELARLSNQITKQEEVHKVELDARNKRKEIRAREIETARQMQEAEKQKDIEEAELERQRCEVLARTQLEAQRSEAEQALVQAQAQAEEIELMASAEKKKAQEFAEALLERGRAEAEALKMKMEAENVINPAQLQKLFIQSLPQVADAMKVKDVRWINMAGSGGGAGQTPMQMVPETIAKCLGVFQGMGIDLPTVLSKVTGDDSAPAEDAEGGCAE